jgi:hypothetical protein
LPLACSPPAKPYQNSLPTAQSAEVCDDMLHNVFAATAEMRTVCKRTSWGYVSNKEVEFRLSSSTSLTDDGDIAGIRNTDNSNNTVSIEVWLRPIYSTVLVRGRDGGVPSRSR